MEKAKKLKLRKGDDVIVITGKYKGTRGQITNVNPATSRVIVAGVNLVKKAVKPNPRTGEEGGLITKEAPIHISNVMLIDPATQRPTRKRPI
jgi:large subunit ribosomal protein L24